MKAIDNIKDFFNKIGNKLVKIRLFAWLKKTYDNIDGYIEDQILSLMIYFGTIYFILLAIVMIFGLNEEKILGLYGFIAIGLSLLKLVKSIMKSGLNGLLIYAFISNFSFKYIGVYIECLLTLFFLALSFRYLNFTNSDRVGLIVIGVLIFKVFISIVTNNLGKIVLNKKLEAMYEEKIYKFDFKDRTYHETMFLLDNLKKTMAESMEEKLRSERLKTELITNISHDIKTPLTSIINYVDLLKNEEDPEEKERYIKTLDYNAKRLKSMVLDLIDASKTGTGNIELNMETIELNELILQVYGQFDTPFSEKGLDFIYNTSRENIYMITDGAQLSRVFENLFTNISKYSLENTRVYGDTKILEDSIVITLKNTSLDKLNIDPDELMQQFVRGERSRHSEGSGLGLYIANNIISLMGGEFNIHIDGDLFTTEIIFRVKKKRKNK